MSSMRSIFLHRSRSLLRTSSFPFRGSYRNPFSSLSSPFHISNSELQPGLSKVEFQSRRKRLFERLPDNSALLVNASDMKYMSNEIPYEFRQNSSFMYLTGLNQPTALAIFVKARGQQSYTLFLPPRDFRREQWDGERIGVHEALSELEADAAFEYDSMQTKLPKILKGLESLFVTRAENGIPYSRHFAMTMNSIQNSKLLEGDAMIESLRVIKSDAELERIRFAAKAATEGFLEMMKVCEAGMTERALAGHFECTCKRHGALWNSFPSVVGSGTNAAVIHYLAKRDVLQKGELLLADAGCEVAGGYVSDITRTWPVSSQHMTAAQRDLYNLILCVQKKCIDTLSRHVKENKPISLDDLHSLSSKEMVQGLVELGVLKSEDKTDRKVFDDYYRYNPTHVGHYLGMDVHDTPSVPRSKALVPGMVITIEPGIYLPQGDLLLPEVFRGLGIRIEDDIIIGKNSIEITTSDLPKTLEGIARHREAI